MSPAARRDRRRCCTASCSCRTRSPTSRWTSATAGRHSGISAACPRPPCRRRSSPLLLMSPEQLGDRVVALVEGAAQVSFGQVTVDVPAERWHDAAVAVRDDAEVACGFFDWLSAYDDPDAFPDE